MSSDLSRSLVDAAAAAVGDTAKVAAVLETLADGIESANWPMSISRLRGLAAEVKAVDGGG